MTRFARSSKKTSLEATPWHELVNSGGSKTGNKAASEDMHHSAGKKRKKTSNVNDGSLKPKKSRKLEYQEAPEGEGENGISVMKKKVITKNKWKMTKNSRKDNHKQMTMKKRLGIQKNVGKYKKKAPATDTYWTETLDKKHEARRKRRAKGKACFHCRQTGHLVSECPLAQDAEMGVGNCYKCGSSEHTTKSCDSKSTEAAGTTFPFAKCFICGETGHIARTCPDNPKGLYPNGGGCKICGSVEHFRRDCPELAKHTKGSLTTAHVQNMKSKKGHYSADAELEDEGGTSYKAPKKKGPHVVKF